MQTYAVQLAADGQNKPWKTTHPNELSCRKKNVYIIMLDCHVLKKTRMPQKKVAQYECRKACNSYFKNLINPESSYPSKRLFSYIKGQRKDCYRVPALKVSGNVVTSNLAKAEEFNKHFRSVFTSEDSNCPLSAGNLTLN